MPKETSRELLTLVAEQFKAEAVSSRLHLLKRLYRRAPRVGEGVDATGMAYGRLVRVTGKPRCEAGGASPSF
ncbi:MAG: hypothetical protein ABI910_08395 [Gemmatimonadota bacterium]